MNKFGLIKNAQEEDKSSSADHVEELYVLKGLPSKFFLMIRRE